MNAPHPREDAVRSSSLVGVFVAVLACALGLPTAAREDETVVVDSCDTSAFWKSTGDGYNPVEIKVGTFDDKEGRRRIRFKFANGAFYVRLTLLPETLPCRKRVNSAWTHCQKGQVHGQETAPHGADHFETEGGRG